MDRQVAVVVDLLLVVVVVGFLANYGGVGIVRGSRGNCSSLRVRALDALALSEAVGGKSNSVALHVYMFFEGGNLEVLDGRVVVVRIVRDELLASRRVLNVPRRVVVRCKVVPL